MSRNTKNLFSSRLKELRGSTSNVEFAKLCGLNTQDIQRYSKEEATPSIDKLAMIAMACDVTTDWLLGISDSKTISTKEKGIRHNVEALKRAATRVCADADALLKSIESLQGVVV
jgi:transcriptional regulator with XRE-family HTH domain